MIELITSTVKITTVTIITTPTIIYGENLLHTGIAVVLAPISK